MTATSQVSQVFLSNKMFFKADLVLTLNKNLSLLCSQANLTAGLLAKNSWAKCKADIVP